MSQARFGRFVAVPLLAIACYAGVMLFATANWFDPLADDRASWSREWSPLVLALLVLLHPVVGFLIASYRALVLIVLPIGGALWAEADCEGGGYIDLCGIFSFAVAGIAVVIGLPLLALGVYIRRSRDARKRRVALRSSRLR